MSNYWSQYWRQGHLTSFGDDIKDNYVGTLKNVWSEVFSALNKDDRVIDIATGNGALVGLIYDAVRQDNLPYIDAIDLAKIQIKEPLLNKSEQTHFAGGINCEQLPFTDNSANLIISQFGIEYSNLKKSLAEVARVLAETGQAQFICHHHDSIIVKPNLAILMMSLELQSKSGGMSIVKRLLAELDKTGKGSPKSENWRNKLNKYMEKLLKTDKNSFMATNFHLFVKAVLQNQAKQSEIINGFEQELKGSIARLTDLANAAISKVEQSKVSSLCKQNHLTIVDFSAVVDDQNNILAWKILLTKA
ncbi:class I SAM-dependent methyltransferase [Thalassotalea sp. ND16A]|uniref:class I SAM-dependent methyltransferase n=1 Tax=Thalassotalea sp. ND16A TaxID=1535422 RepID=UPI00051DF14E|nr:class I SAM-dependent methyltransferase [Thalassotalea sp. ND16A]KGK00934.1 hypothetical protein ND16A_3136 [Thalassotalea sp. ND16A]